MPWEDAVDEANERKRLCYAELSAGAEQRGWRAMVRPVEVGCRGFVESAAKPCATLLRKHQGLQNAAECPQLCHKSVGGHTPGFDQCVVGLPQQRVYGVNKRPKHI